MGKIEFYYMPESPPCRTVEAVASLVNVELDKHYLNLFTKDQLKEDFLKKNPLHRVPFIIDGELRLNESRAISRYLVNKYAPDNTHLYPKDPVKRALVDELLDLDIDFYQTVSKLLKPLLFGTAKHIDSEVEKEYREKVGYLELRLNDNGGRPFLLGDQITIADVSLATSFTFPQAFGFDFSNYTTLLSYLDKVRSSIPKYSEINDEAEKNMKEFIKSKLNSQ